MKKTYCILTIVLLLIFILSGCSGLTISKDTTADPVYKVGRLAGAYVRVAEPGYVSVVLPYAEGLQAIAKSGEVSSAQVDKAVGMLTDKFGSDEKYKVIAALFLAEFRNAKIETGKVNDKLVLLLNGFLAGLRL